MYLVPAKASLPGVLRTWACQATERFLRAHQIGYSRNLFGVFGWRRPKDRFSRDVLPRGRSVRCSKQARARSLAPHRVGRWLGHVGRGDPVWCRTENMAGPALACGALVPFDMW